MGIHRYTPNSLHEVIGRFDVCYSKTVLNTHELECSAALPSCMLGEQAQNSGMRMLVKCPCVSYTINNTDTHTYAYRHLHMFLIIEEAFMVKSNETSIG